MKLFAMTLLAISLCGCSGISAGVAFVPGKGLEVGVCLDSTSPAYAKIKGGADKIKVGGLLDGLASLAACADEEKESE